MFRVLPLEEHAFQRAAIKIGGWLGNSAYVCAIRFRAFFNVSTKVCATIWPMLLPSLPSHTEAKHLLWALMFLKGYNSECVNAGIARVDEKTFRRWCSSLVKLIAEAKVVSIFLHLLFVQKLTKQVRWERRLDGSVSVFKSSVDGTDFRIREPTPFNSKWFSHKFRGLRLRYEVGLSIAGDEIIWAHGPFPCGSFSDLRIFRMGMKHALLQNEKVVADRGCQDPSCSYPITTDGNIQFQYVRARQEALNKL